jgi:ribosomal-protein-alanine N-acetyltransferase
MEAKDLAEVLAIEERSFTAPWTRGAFERLLRRPTAEALVAVERGSVVGYAVFWTVDGEAELGNLDVRATCGAARRAGARTLYLEVRESNEAARSLYGELGFRNVTRRRGYYRSPSEDALVLARELEDPVPSTLPEPEER